MTFKSDAMAGLFQKNLSKFEQAAAQVAGRAIKFSVVVDKNMPAPVLQNLSESARNNLAGAMDIFHANDADKIND